MKKTNYTNANSTRHGEILRTARFDLRCKPQIYARTWKMFNTWKHIIEKQTGKRPDSCAEVWEKIVLMLTEHCVRELKINGKNMEIVMKLSRPLPKCEYVRAAKKLGKEVR